MLETLTALLRSEEALDLADDDYRSVVLMALQAVENGGYIQTPASHVLESLPRGVVGQDAQGWFFFTLRSRSRELARKGRWNAKRPQRTKPSSEDASAQESCTHDSCSVLKPNTVSTPLRPAGACARNSNILCEPGENRPLRTVPSSEDGFDDAITLFEDFDKPPEKRKRPARPQPWHPLYDAVVEVTHADTRKSTRAHVAKVARDLHDCDPPYTADDVRRLPEILSRQSWWALGMNVSIAIVQKHIGLVRAVREVEASAKEEPVKTLADYREAAIRAWREQCRGL